MLAYTLEFVKKKETNMYITSLTGRFHSETSPERIYHDLFLIHHERSDAKELLKNAELLADGNFEVSIHSLPSKETVYGLEGTGPTLVVFVAT